LRHDRKKCPLDPGIGAGSDLSAHRPSTKGQYIYDVNKQQIDWSSGDWKDRIGTYMPNVKGTDFVVVHTKKDPEGRIDGVLRCARTAP
jgi:hypothetical protein